MSTRRIRSRRHVKVSREKYLEFLRKLALQWEKEPERHAELMENWNKYLLSSQGKSLFNEGHGNEGHGNKKKSKKKKKKKKKKGGTRKRRRSRRR